MRGVRLALALGMTGVVLAIALAYPVLARGDAWLGARFEYPWLLLLLAVVPVLWYLGTYGHDRRNVRLRIGTVAPFLSGPVGWRAYARDLPGIVRAVAVFLLVIGIARPVSLLRDQKSDDKGIDIAVVLDLSNSMRAVLDANPKDLPGRVELPRGKRLTRLDTAKVVLKDFISRRQSDRIAIVVFGSAAYVLSPATRDYHLLTQLVSKMELNVIDGNGTAIGDALGTAVARLRRSDAHSKVILLLTDGDSNAGSISPEYAAQLAQGIGARINTIQIGTDSEVDVEDGVDLFGQPHYSKRTFATNPELLKKMADMTGGQAFVATDAKGLANSMHSILDQLEKTRFEASIASFDELFPFLIVPGALLIALDALLRAWILRRFP